MKKSIKLTINNKIIIFSVTFGLLIVAIIIFVIFPFYTKISELNEELYNQRVQLAIHEKQRLNADETKLEYNNIKEDIENITSVMVKRDDLLIFLDSLDLLANQNSLQQTINLGDLDESIKLHELIINVNLVGTWDNINEYLYTIEGLEYYILVDNISFVVNDSKIVESSFNLVIYLE